MALLTHMCLNAYISYLKESIVLAVVGLEILKGYFKDIKKGC